MVTALDVARFFIELGAAQAEQETGDAMTNLRLNKLLYYAQGYTLARLDHPLFEDRIEAWAKGPVVPTVYYHYKENKTNPLNDEPFNRELISPEEFNLLFEVYANTRDLSTSNLIDKTHEDGTPWKTVYEENCNHEIPVELISNYFKCTVPPPRKLKAKVVQPLYYDQEGTPVFSREEVYGYA